MKESFLRRATKMKPVLIPDLSDPVVYLFEYCTYCFYSVLADTEFRWCFMDMGSGEMEIRDFSHAFIFCVRDCDFVLLYCCYM